MRKTRPQKKINHLKRRHMGLTPHAIYIMNALRQTDLIMWSPSSASGFLKDSDNPEGNDDIGVESRY